MSKLKEFLFCGIVVPVMAVAWFIGLYMIYLFFAVWHIFVWGCFYILGSPSAEQIIEEARIYTPIEIVQKIKE
jgi:hypothetical protein